MLEPIGPVVGEDEPVVVVQHAPASVRREGSDALVRQEPHVHLQNKSLFSPY